MANDSIEQIIKSIFNELRTQGIILINSIIDQHDDYSRQFAKSLIADFYNSYTPSVYIRKYDLYEGIQYVNEELKLDASELSPFNSGVDPETVLNMIGNGIRFYLPWSGKIMRYTISGLSINMGAIGTFNYSGNIRNGINAWNTRGKEMFVNYFDKQINILLNEYLY